MRFHAVLAVAAALGFGAVQAQQIMKANYPPKCGASCGPIVIQQRHCEGQPTSQKDCVCTWAKKNDLIPQCQVCIEQYFPTNDNLQTANSLITECNLKKISPSVTNNLAAATAAPILGAGVGAIIAGLAAL